MNVTKNVLWKRKATIHTFLKRKTIYEMLENSSKLSAVAVQAVNECE